MIYDGIECEFVIKGDPANIEVFDIDKLEYKSFELYLTDFNAVSELPLLEKVIWVFFDKFTNCHPFGDFPAVYLRIGIDELSDIFKEDIGAVDKAIENLIDMKRLLVFDESEDKMLAYAAI
jgi:hypothetical protein